MPPRIAYLTAGAAGMYCGSCMHDNTLARTLTQRGVDIQLIPTYTPIRTDEENVSVDQVFFGGINVYLEQTIPGFRFIPSFLLGFLDRPGLLRWAAKRGMQLSPKKLGGLTVSMLKGSGGYQRREVQKLCRWLRDKMQPDLINLSNMLIAGCVPSIKKARNVPVVATLQGDDIFLNELVEPYREQALQEMRRLVQSIDGFIANSSYYADYMSDLLHIPPDKMNIVPLGIDVRDFPQTRSVAASAEPQPVTIGYLARVAPEKGLHVLVDAFLLLKQQPQTELVSLHVAGWLGEHNRDYLQQQLDKIEAAGWSSSFDYLGTIDRQQKLAFLGDVDLLCVPTTYREPKGLFVLEALASGVPVVQPDHGAFPEILAETGGGTLVSPDDPASLATALQELVGDPDRLRQMGNEGSEGVRAKRSEAAMGDATMAVFDKYLR